MKTVSTLKQSNTSEVTANSSCYQRNIVIATVKRNCNFIFINKFGLFWPPKNM